MKKIIAISMVAVSLGAMSSFGQGYFILSSSKSQVYDGFTTPGVSALGATVNVAFLWAAGAVTPAVSSLLASTPITGNSTTTESYTVATAWSDILSGQFTLAVNNNTSAAVTALSAANGSVVYNSASSFPVTGTTAGTAYTVYEIGWSSAYATPAAAAAAGGAVGWSSPVSYTPSIATDQTLTSIVAPKFGVFTPFVPTPEPATLALAGLGGASLLLFRRKK